MNRPVSLDHTLNYIVKGSDIPKQLIVIDQSQKDEYRTENLLVCEKYKKMFPSLILEYQKIPSLTKARNLGISLSSEEIIVFMDDDVDVKKDTMSNVHSLFSDSRIAMAGGIQEGEQDVQNSIMSYILGMASFRKREIGHVARSCYGRFPIHCCPMTESQWAMGFFFAVRRSLLMKWAITFDERLLSYAYAEDLDFSYRYYKHASSEGYRCIMSSSLMVVHNISKEYRIPNRKTTFMHILHRYYLSHKLKFTKMIELHNLWCNLGLFVDKLLKKEPVRDLWDAQVFYFKHRREIKGGELLNNKWM